LISNEVSSNADLLGSIRRASGEIKERAREAFLRFQDGAEDPPFHPSLRVRKMQGHPGIWEGHITLQYVFTFHIEYDPQTGEIIYVFRNIGIHDIYRRP